LECFLGNGRGIRGLPAQPPAVAQTKVAAKPKIRVGCDRTLASDNFADSLCRYANVLCEAVLRKTKWLEEFFFKHLAWGDRWNSAHCFFLQ